MAIDELHPQFSTITRAAEGIDRDQDAGRAALERQLLQSGPSSAAALLGLAQLLPAAVVASERAEYERIVKRLGKEDLRAKALEDSLDSLERMDNLAALGRARAARALEIVQTPDAVAFHGFVSAASGEPAAGMTVRLTVPKLREGLSATTAQDGYFRLPLKGDASRATVKPAAAAEPAGAAGESSDSAQVSIEDASGKRLLQDPLPLPLGSGSAYREYVLPERGEAERDSSKRETPEPGRTSRPRKGR